MNFEPIYVMIDSKYQSLNINKPRVAPLLFSFPPMYTPLFHAKSDVFALERLVATNRPGGYCALEISLILGSFRPVTPVYSVLSGGSSLLAPPFNHSQKNSL